MSMADIYLKLKNKGTFEKFLIRHTLSILILMKIPKNKYFNVPEKHHSDLQKNNKWLVNKLE